MIIRKAVPLYYAHICLKRGCSSQLYRLTLEDNIICFSIIVRSTSQRVQEITVMLYGIFQQYKTYFSKGRDPLMDYYFTLVGNSTRNLAKFLIKAKVKMEDWKFLPSTV